MDTLTGLRRTFQGVEAVVVAAAALAGSALAAPGPATQRCGSETPTPWSLERARERDEGARMSGVVGRAAAFRAAVEQLWSPLYWAPLTVSSARG